MFPLEYMLRLIQFLFLLSGAAYLHLRHAQERYPESAEQEEAEGQRGRRFGRDGFRAPGGRPLPIAGS